MKKAFRLSIIIAIVFSAFASTAKAQKLFFIFGHGLYAIPFDANFNSLYRYGLGIEGGAGIGWKKTFLTATTGYTEFKAATGNHLAHLNYYPLKIGVRHYLPVKILFLNADAGAAFISNAAGGTSATKFSGDLGFGVKLGMFEALANYNGFTRSDPSGYASWIEIKAGIHVGL